MTDGTWFGYRIEPDMALEFAELSAEHHQIYAPSLFEELQSMASAAELTTGEAILVGGFTDIVDIVRTQVGSAISIDECTGILNPELGFLAQTWDMNMSAGEYVFMMKIEPESGPRALVQTTTGCLGQIGMNEAGIAVGINNLTANGRLGVTWPFVVRAVLQQSDLDSAVAEVMRAHLAGGHNYFLMGPDGTAVNIEAMPNSVRVTKSSLRPMVHTNHCIDPANAAIEPKTPKDMAKDSQLRMEVAYSHADDPSQFFADPRISKRGVNPHDGATCGAVIMRTRERSMEAIWGVPGYGEWEQFFL